MMKFLYQDVPELSGESYKAEFVFSRYEYDEEEDVLLSLMLTHRVTKGRMIYPIAVLNNAIINADKFNEKVTVNMYKDTINAIYEVECTELGMMMFDFEDVVLEANSIETYTDKILNFNRDYYKFSLEACMVIGKIITKFKEQEEDDEEDMVEIIDELDEIVGTYIANRIMDALGGSELMIEVDENTTVKLKV